jgi:DNA-binding response OmpR family regulator
MVAATVHGLPVPIRELPAPPPANTSVTVTVRIELGDRQLSPAAVGLLESLRALAEVGNHEAVVTPARVSGMRPRLVRSTSGGTAHSPALRIDPASRTVLRDGLPIRLTRREYELLVFLCRNPRRVFSRGQLLVHVWGYEMVSGERTVDVHVRRLRAKLGDRGPVIATVRGVGYRLDEAANVAVEPEASA